MTFSKLRTMALAIALLATSSLFFTVGPAGASTKVAMNSRGDITITGDNKVQIALLEVDSAGELTVTIKDAQGQAQTTHYIGSDYRDLKVNLKGGDDAIVVESAGRPSFRKVTINLGSGRNTAVIDNADVSDRLTIIDGSGNADVRIERAVISGSVTVNLGGGANLFESIANQTDGKFTLSTSSSGQVEGLISHHRHENGAFTVRGGNKADSLSIVRFGGAGSSVLVDLKAGDDRVEIQRTDIEGTTNVKMGSGNDVTLMDVVWILGNLSYRGGSGNDSFSTTSSTYGPTKLHGGGGVDSLSRLGNSFFPEPVVTSFENT